MNASPRSHLRLFAALVALVFALGGTACGGGSDKKDEQAIKQRVNGFYDALGSRDAAKVCASITKARRQALATPGGQGPKSCNEALRFSFVLAGKAFKNAGKASVTDVEVKGDRARATVSYRNKKGGVGLSKEDGDWLISNFNLKKL
jgi:hypothetical protein